MKSGRLVLCFAGLILSTSFSFAQQYLFTNLGSAAGIAGGANAYGINQSSVVAGVAWLTGNSSSSAGFWSSPSTFSPINGTLSNALEVGASAVNAGGAVSLYAYNQIGSTTTEEAYYWSSSTGLVHLGHPTGNFWDAAMGVNDSGEVVGGDAFTFIGKPWAWTSSGGFQLLDTPNTGVANGVNASGSIVGLAGGQAALWTSATSSVQLLGTGQAYAINNGGAVTGYLNSGGNEAGFYRTSGGTMMSIATTSGYTNLDGYALNSSNVVVGGEWNNDYRAIIWTQADGTRDLNTLLAPGQGVGWTLQYASGINDAGQIVGLASDANGNSTAYILTPVPEPATILALGAGLAVAFARRRRKL